MLDTLKSATLEVTGEGGAGAGGAAGAARSGVVAGGKEGAGGGEEGAGGGAAVATGGGGGADAGDGDVDSGMCEGNGVEEARDGGGAGGEAGAGAREDARDGQAGPSRVIAAAAKAQVQVQGVDGEEQPSDETAATEGEALADAAQGGVTLTPAGTGGEGEAAGRDVAVEQAPEEAVEAAGEVVEEEATAVRESLGNQSRRPEDLGESTVRSEGGGGAEGGGDRGGGDAAVTGDMPGEEVEGGRSGGAEAGRVEVDVEGAVAAEEGGVCCVLMVSLPAAYLRDGAE